MSIDLFDGLAFVGILLIAIGLWLVTPALSLSIVGALLLAVGLIGARGPRAPKRGKN
jgi:uncharacterized membrane protein